MGALSRDGIAGLALFGASLVLLFLTGDIERNPLVAIGPGFYPRIVLSVTAVLSALLVVGDYVSIRRRSAIPATPLVARLNYALVLGAFAIFIGYVVALPYLGFRVATFLFVAGLRATLDPPRNPRAWLGVVALAALTAVATWLVFEHYLSVLLPRGRWTDF